jgi:hypothetical protein
MFPNQFSQDTKWKDVPRLDLDSVRSKFSALFHFPLLSNPDCISSFHKIISTQSGKENESQFYSLFASFTLVFCQGMWKA